MHTNQRAQEDTTTSKKPPPRGGSLFGISIILVGLFLLLDQLGWLSPYHLFDFWPLLLILAGVAKFSLPGGSIDYFSAGLMVLAGVLIQLYSLDIIQI